MRILVVDDDRVSAHLLCSTLRRAGWTADAAFDVPQAMAIIAEGPPPDVITLDINMPGGNGLDMLVTLKASAATSAIPVVVVSGDTDPQAATKAESLGAEVFLAKPMDIASLTMIVGYIGTRHP